MYCRLIVLLLPFTLLRAAISPCDLNGDGQVNVVDVQRSTNQALGIDTCNDADLNLDDRCDVVDVQRFINAAMGQECQAAQPPPAGGGSSVTAYGAKCDGSSDDTTAIRAAFNDRANWQSSTLTFPAGKTCIIGQQLTLKNISNFTILGQGATIKAKNGMCTDSGASPGCTGSGPMLLIQNVDNFTIDNLDTDGNRANRVPAEKSGGHNVRLAHVTNGTFRNLDWKNSTTDSLIIDANVKSDLSTRSQDLRFVDSKFINGYRDSVSVISGVNIRFEGTCSGGFTGSCTCQMSGANGTDPQAGIDWEPDEANASPAISGGVVDGCLIENNSGVGLNTSSKSGTQNVSLFNSIIRNNGKAAFRLSSTGGRVEGNWIGKQTAAEFGVIYISRGDGQIVENNFIDGTPPVGSATGQRHVIWFGNFGSTTAQFKNNKITNIHTNASGDWCRSSTAGGASTTQGNTVNNVMQSPNPGCP
jgi:hypothetical protein